MDIISSQTHLSCVLEESEHVSALGMKMLSQMKDAHVISAAQVRIRIYASVCVLSLMTA